MRVAERLVAAGGWLWRQVRLLADVRANPATFVYLFTLFVTSAVLAGAGQQLTQALLHSESTNLANLGHEPVRVLFTSAFWLSNDVGPVLLIVPFAVVLAPAERWLGTLRWLVVFAAGHVGATILTASVIWLELRYQSAPRSLTHTVDVGVSYGFLAVVGVLTYRVPHPWRRAYVLGVVVVVALGVFVDAALTDIGHVFAFCIGLACWPLVPDRRRASATKPAA